MKEGQNLGFAPTLETILRHPKLFLRVIFRILVRHWVFPTQQDSKNCTNPKIDILLNGQILMKTLIVVSEDQGILHFGGNTPMA